MIYLLEDDESIRKLVIYALESQGFEASGFSAPEQFYEALKKNVPELLLLDIMLPDEDGISILKRLRSQGMNFPVIMMTAKNSEYDKVQGLDAGADDYIAKPFGIMELIARVRAVLRRYSGNNKRTLEFDSLVIIPDKREVLVEGEKIELTNKEYLLLEFMAQNPEIVLTREVLLDRIWGAGMERENRTLDVHIRSLRAKLGVPGKYIQTVRSVGYKFKT